MLISRRLRLTVPEWEVTGHAHRLPLRWCLVREALQDDLTGCFNSVNVGPSPSGAGRAVVETSRLRLPAIVTWLILPVVICLSQRLSHACLSINASIL